MSRDEQRRWSPRGANDRPALGSSRKAAPCGRSWEAEALADGRLSGSSRDSFERHLADCAACQGEVAELARLRALGQAIAPAPLDPLQRRRLRVALLRAAHGEGRAAPSPRRPMWTMAAAAVLLVGGGAFAARARWHRSAARTAMASSASASARPPTFEVADVASAHWRTEVAGAETRLILDRGTAAFHVDHLGAGQRFVVRLPDGELEVRGTRFVVDVEAGSTRAVRVTEGVVALRIGHDAERLLRAGDRFEGAPPVEPTPAAPSATDANAPARAATTTAHTPVAATPSAPPIGSMSASASARSTASASSRAASELAAAMLLLKQERWAEADAALAAFAERHGDDARAEDAAFLRIAAHRKLNDAAGARALAKDYLARYPRGFRAAEARALLSGE
jgi:hypothetical protein